MTESWRIPRYEPEYRPNGDDWECMSCHAVAPEPADPRDPWLLCCDNPRPYLVLVRQRIYVG